MKTRTLALAALALLAAACNEDDAPGPASTTTLVADRINDSTTDAALPIEINTLQISDADTDESSPPFSVN